jgi:hypothetical protein
MNKNWDPQNPLHAAEYLRSKSRPKRLVKTRLGLAKNSLMLVALILAAILLENVARPRRCTCPTCGHQVARPAAPSQTIR